MPSGGIESAVACACARAAAETCGAGVGASGAWARSAGGKVAATAAPASPARCCRRVVVRMVPLTEIVNPADDLAAIVRLPDGLAKIVRGVDDLRAGRARTRAARERLDSHGGPLHSAAR